MNSYDIVIIGGAMVGSSIAFWTSRDPDFKGRIAVIERDPSYEFASTTHTNSCIRQQFGTRINIQISQFGAEFINNFKYYMGDDAPDIPLQNYGYMYLADTEEFADVLRENQRLQASMGAGTRIMSRDDIAAAYPFYNLDDVICGSHNTLNEGYFDGGTIFDWFRKKARAQGVEYIKGDVTGISRSGGTVTGVTLADGTQISAGKIVNASGPRANITAQMAGLHVPVEARRRYTFIFDAAAPLDRDLPLTIDPSGVHMRSDGRYYLAGCPPDDDPAVDFDDFTIDHGLWENKVWPVLATRVPAFEQIKLINTWVGHYAYNTLDQNAIVGPHPEVGNFYFANGFSGHGLQQSPAIGRGMAELLVHGQFRTLDLAPLGYDRIASNTPFVERAVI
ncbi:FAD-binding oxidoreductase [Octadecabacter sp. SW4]|uniref:NAD(P)/FAD-dependent oxidoreductase n=1 Tax=Octadecabacter sp. SW4 TaxID=2602067 RepID=UPI0011C1F43E|nr:FAD-binding oxidoreductase [Octadecabacter sp. SW4]QEE34749.1 FAD-binding oxidoreductase [Octadecabacter sp. SW4]